jgi:MFS family permease
MPRSDALSQEKGTSRSHRGLVGLLAAEAVSLSGSRLSMIAIPWFMITTTGSPLLTGMAAFAEGVPYVVAKALGGPMIDRLGARRVTVAADGLSALTVAAIPVLHALGLLPLGVFLALVALLGLFRGPADAATKTLIPAVAEQSRVPLERATGLSGTLERLATTVGAAGAGALVAVIGPIPALLLNSAAFAVAMLIVRLTVSVPPPDDVEADGEGGYFARLRTGFVFFIGERFLRSLAGMIAATNLLTAAMVSVLLPVWAHSTGHGPAAMGVLNALFAGSAIGTSLLASAFAERLPRRATFLVGFLLTGAPRFIILAMDVPLWLIGAVWVIAGLGQGTLNPILWAVIFERIPRHLLGRVQSLISSLTWAGIPLGPPIAGALLGLFGLGPVLVLCGIAFFAVTAPVGLQREWSEMERAKPDG